MSNELQVLKASTFNYQFKPATIEIENYGELMETAKSIAGHYDSLVFKNSTLSEINEAHRELNSFVQGLNESRLSVKREYNKPLDEFENKIKDIQSILNEPLQVIKDERDSILEKQREAREEALIEYLKRKLKDTLVKIDDLEIPDNWTNKGNWTEKFNPRVKLKDEIDFQIKQVEEEQKKKLADRKVLETFLDEKGMEHEGWIVQLDHGRQAVDIIQEIVQVKQEKESSTTNLTPDKEEADVLNQEGIKSSPTSAQTTKKELFSQRIEVTGTKEQFKLLDQFMTDNGILYMPV